jgi:hypothetical protein
LQSILKKIEKNDIIEAGCLHDFISAVYNACKNKNEIEEELLKWGATKEEIKNVNGESPYFLIEIAWAFNLSKYLQKVIEIELTPASELLKK